VSEATVPGRTSDTDPVATHATGEREHRVGSESQLRGQSKSEAEKCGQAK
jgi:hypothetical protein